MSFIGVHASALQKGNDGPEGSQRRPSRWRQSLRASYWDEKLVDSADTKISYIYACEIVKKASGRMSDVHASLLDPSKPLHKLMVSCFGPDPAIPFLRTELCGMTRCSIGGEGAPSTPLVNAYLRALDTSDETLHDSRVRKPLGVRELDLSECRDSANYELHRLKGMPALRHLHLNLECFKSDVIDPDVIIQNFVKNIPNTLHTLCLLLVDSATTIRVLGALEAEFKLNTHTALRCIGLYWDTKDAATAEMKMAAMRVARACPSLDALIIAEPVWTEIAMMQNLRTLVLHLYKLRNTDFGGYEKCRQLERLEIRMHDYLDGTNYSKLSNVLKTGARLKEFRLSVQEIYDPTLTLPFDDGNNDNEDEDMKQIKTLVASFNADATYVRDMPCLHMYNDKDVNPHLVYRDVLFLEALLVSGYRPRFSKDLIAFAALQEDGWDNLSSYLSKDRETVSIIPGVISDSYEYTNLIVHLMCRIAREPPPWEEPGLPANQNAWTVAFDHDEHQVGPLIDICGRWAPTVTVERIASLIARRVYDVDKVDDVAVKFFSPSFLSSLDEPPQQILKVSGNNNY